MRQEIKSLLGLIYKSQNLVFGEKVFSQLKSGKIYLVILSNDIGAASQRKLLNKIGNVPVIKLGTKAELASAFGKGQISNIGIINKKLAEKLIKMTEV